MEQEFIEWAGTLSKKYQKAQLEVAKEINCSMLSFFSDLGSEIAVSPFKEKNHFSFYEELSKELIERTSKQLLFSAENIMYIESFYLLSVEIYKWLLEKRNVSLEDSNASVELSSELFSKITDITWDHHRIIIDQFFDNPEKAWSYINQTIENGWGKDSLLEKIREEFVLNGPHN